MNFILGSKYFFFLLIGLAVALEVVGDVILKKWSTENKTTLLIVGLVIYFIGSAFWIISLKYEYLSKAISIFTILNLIAVVLAGTLYLKEDLTVTNKIGIGLGIISLILIEL